MITLAVDTSAAVGSVALLKDGKLLAESTTNSFPSSPRTKSITHSTNLVPAIERLISNLKFEFSNCDLLAVGLGPGSFTGIRVAIATMKGYALALKKPVVGVSSVDAMALANKDRMPANCSSLVVLVDAGRGEVYCSAYSVLEGQFFKVNDVTIVPFSELRSRILSPTCFIGPEVDSFRSELTNLITNRYLADAQVVTPSAFHVGLLAEEKFGEQQVGDRELEPIYLRPAAVKAKSQK